MRYFAKETFDGGSLHGLGEQYLYNSWKQFLSSLGLKDLGWKTLAEILKSWGV
jgi:hypothetical protein